MAIPLALKHLVPLRIRAWNMRRFLPRLPAVTDLAPAGSDPQKRALLSYKTASFRLLPGDPEQRNFSHHGLGTSMVEALNGLGYTVDVVDYQHPAPRLVRPYDLFVGHMNMNFTALARQLPAGIPRIYLATTLPWRMNNARERERLRALRRRRGVTLPEERLIYFNEDGAYRRADAIICTGNEYSRRAYAPHPRVIPLRNAATEEPRPVPADKDFERARRHFLFFAGPGNVHKGLDLLLEIFPSLGAAGFHLHVCQYIAPGFAAAYRRELTSTPNIHVHGNVAVRSPEYYRIVDQCAYLISPSCAEGGQGAVAEALHQGLVPILSPECTVDVTPGGIMLRDCARQTLADAVHTAAAKEPAEVHANALAAQAHARRDYSREAFIRGFRDAITSITDRRRP